MALLGVDGRFRLVNRTFAHMLGYGSDELTALTDLQITHPEDREENLRVAQSLLDGTRASASTEARYMGKTGRVLDFSVHTSLIRDADGQPQYFLSQYADIGERRRDAAILYSEKRLMEMVARGEAQDVFLAKVTETISSQIEGFAAALFLLDEARTKLILQKAEGMSPRLAATLVELDVGPDRGFLAACAFFNRRMLLGGDAEARSDVTLHALAEAGFGSGWATPIRTRNNRVLGVLAAFSSQRAVDPRDIDLVERTVRIAGIGLEREHADRRLRESEERHLLALRGAKDGIWDWDILKDRLYVSERWQEIAGSSAQDRIGSGRAWMCRLYPDDRRPIHTRLRAHLEGRTPYFEAEYRMLRSDGKYCWVLSRGVALRNDSGQAYRMAGSLSDITERKRAESRLEFEALHDPLTGLPNRTFFLGRLDRCLRDGEGVFHHALLLLDLDRFKTVNDSLGNPIGDRVLVAVAKRLRSALGSRHLLARVGGDQFVILVEHERADQECLELADKILKLLAAPFRIQDYEVSATASIGLVDSVSGYNRPEDVVRDADSAMLRAKERGRACSVVFDAGMKDRRRESARLEKVIRRALQDGSFALAYQPIVERRTGRVVGGEALLRLQGPRLDGLNTQSLVTVAEESGLIVRLGEWVFKEACAFSARLAKELGDCPRIAVNASPHQFRHSDFPSMAAAALSETGARGENITIELTEGLFLGFEADVLGALGRLKALGFQLSIDDFGTGYSSLAYLKRLPIDSVKIDRSFVMGIPDDEDGAAITGAMVALGHILQVKVVAEGVERQAQIDFLSGFECDYLQGFGISRPLGADEFIEFFRQNSTRTEGTRLIRVVK